MKLVIGENYGYDLEEGMKSTFMTTAAIVVANELVDIAMTIAIANVLAMASCRRNEDETRYVSVVYTPCL